MIRPIINNVIQPVISGVTGKSRSSYWTQQCLLRDTCDSQTINTNNWETTFSDAIATTFTQNKGLAMRTLIPICATGYNIIKTKVHTTSGFWKFSVMDVGYPTHAARYRRFGLIDTGGTERVRFERKTSQATVFTMYINYGGSNVYNIDTTITDLAQVKIAITPTHNIEVYQWMNDTWVQIGTTQNYDIGDCKLYMLSIGNTYFEKTSFKDVYLCKVDFDTINPGNLDDTTPAIDPRTYGAIPDGSTNCATAINNALAVGDVILKNGVFALDSSIVIPSNRTISIRNAKVRLNNNKPDNFFRNSDFSGGNSYINIIGLGHAVLDSNSANNDDSYLTWGTNAFSVNAWHYPGIFLYNTSHFNISTLNFSDRLHFGMILQKATYGTIDDIFLGYRLPSLVNQDGFNIYWGSHDINVDNIDIISTDDIIGIGAGSVGGFAYQAPNYNVGDVYNITRGVTNVYYTTNQSKLLALICGDGNKVHDVFINNVNAKIIGSVFSTVYSSPYITTPAAKTDLYNITFDQIQVDENDNAALFQIGTSMQNVTITNLTNNSAKPLYTISAGIEFSSFSINGTTIALSDALITRMTALSETPDSTRLAIINTAINNSNLHSNWTNKFDTLWAIAAHGPNSAKLNFIKNANNITLVNTPTFTTDRGYTGDISGAAALNTNYNLSSDSVLYTQNACSFGIYLRLNIDALSEVFSGWNGTNGTAFLPRYLNTAYQCLNSVYGNVANSDSRGMWIFSRSSSGFWKAYHNGTLFVDESGTVSAALVSVIIHLLCRNTSGTLDRYSANQVALAFIGGYMSQTDITNFQTDWVDGYLNSIGAKV
jgi:hypothetical protein